MSRNMFNFFSEKREVERYKESQTISTLGTTIMLFRETKETENFIVKFLEDIGGIKYCPEYIIRAFRKTEGLSDTYDQALAMFICAISICPKNSESYWNAISVLHSKGRNQEAFDFYSKMPDKKIIDAFDIHHFVPEIVGVLIALGKINSAKEIFVTGLQDLRNEKSPFKMHPPSMMVLSLVDSKKFLNLLVEIEQSGNITTEEMLSYRSDCLEEMALKVKCLKNGDRLSEALEYADFVLDSEAKDFGFINRDKLKVFQKYFLKEIEEEKKWNLDRTDDEFLTFLFRRLAFKFHPDLATDENDRVHKTKIMSEVNQAYDRKDLAKLEDIVRQNIPKRSKYLRHG